MRNNVQQPYPQDFNKMILRLASPEDVLSWSSGEVTKPETINYRTQRSERGGLFDEKIFGPEKDFECYCGKYRGIRYRGIVCEKCGVELTRSMVRRDRMGHIELASPVSHVWFLKGVPSRMALILGIPANELERVIYFAGYIVTKVLPEERERIAKTIASEFKAKIKTAATESERGQFKTLSDNARKEIMGIKECSVLDEATYHRYSRHYGSIFEARIGAEAIYEILKNTDLKKLAEELSEEYGSSASLERQKIRKRLSLVRGMIAASIRPEWMLMKILPIVPPGLRPMVALDGGRHATSDLNDLYRRIINRNNRLKKLQEISAPDVILRNEKRILQEAVDALIDNTIKRATSGNAMNQAQRRPLKSLADNLKGKQGLFRHNLLGKRVDYSGRSVIVVGPELKLNQCGLPKHMALELFRPFVVGKLLERELAFNIRGAGRLIDDESPEVWAILEEVTRDKYVLLNRAPTLHRLGIQAFQPILIEGNAIQLHPLVCIAFNADFDGDQMAVHVPLSREAQAEAAEIMCADKNLLKPSTGDPIVSINHQDIVLGCYWSTKISDGEKGEGTIYPDPNSAINAYDFGLVDLRAKIKVLPTDKQKYSVFENKIFETSVGRLLFNSILPSDYPYLNIEIDRKRMASMVNDLMARYTLEEIPPLLDRIKRFGFTYATRSGVTWGIDEINVPKEKTKVVAEAQALSDEIVSQYEDGLLSADERYRKNIEIWYAARDQIEKLVPQSLDPKSSVHDMWRSGARGSSSQITQMGGMKGLIVSTSGETIELPIISSMKEGLTPLEYFISTHGSRKGLTDTALNTAKAGYLTRRLFDVAQDIVIKEENCGTDEAMRVSKKYISGIDLPFERIITGRILAEDITDNDGKIIFPKGHFITKNDADIIAKSETSEAFVSSPLACATLRGICKRCYGMDMGTGKMIELGEAIGTVAAQAIGEPATQLTMRTFHTGGAASVGGDITRGLPRVEEIFERRQPKNPAIIAEEDGIVLELKEKGREKAIVVLPEDGGKETEYLVPFRRMPVVQAGNKVQTGDLLTDGSADLVQLYKYAGKEKTQQYIINESSRIYELQGASVSRKHIEVIVRQMFSRVRIKDPGHSDYAPGDILEHDLVSETNKILELNGKNPIKFERSIMGISDVSLSRHSFLSAASFQHMTKVLIRSAVGGSIDTLRGLKENVILGRIIPAGSGFKGSWKEKIVREATK